MKLFIHSLTTRVEYENVDFGEAREGSLAGPEYNWGDLQLKKNWKATWMVDSDQNVKFQVLGVTDNPKTEVSADLESS